MPLQGRRAARSRVGRRAHGQALVEFALVFPIFVLILAGIIDFGLGLYSDMTVINAAREGARLGVVLSDKATMSTAVEARVRAMASGLNLSELTVPPPTCLRAGAACTGTLYVSGDIVVVTVAYNYRMIWPLTFGTVIPMSSTVQMRIE